MDCEMYNYLKKQEMLFAFNIWDINSAKAVMDAAVVKKRDVILQTSSGIFESLEKKQLREFVSSYANDLGLKAWLHLDHCRDIEKIKTAQ